MSNSFLALNHVSARHGRNEDDTLYDVCVEISKGEVIGVLGSSG